MIQYTSPASIEWFSLLDRKIPDAKVCHPDTRIIIWSKDFDGNECIHFLYPSDFHFWMNKKYLANYENCSSHKMYLTSLNSFFKDKQEILYWGWWKHFRKI
jgi:hypothetical protein